MNSDVIKRVNEINKVLWEMVPKMLEDVEKQAGFELTGQHTDIILDTYVKTISLLEEHFDSKIKYEYLVKPNQCLTEEDIESIEANKGKTFTEIITGLGTTATNKEVLYVVDAFAGNANKYNNADDELTDAMIKVLVDICMFVRLYNKERAEEIADEVNEICKSWKQASNE